MTDDDATPVDVFQVNGGPDVTSAFSSMAEALSARTRHLHSSRHPPPRNNAKARSHSSDSRSLRHPVLSRSLRDDTHGVSRRVILEAGCAYTSLFLSPLSSSAEASVLSYSDDSGFSLSYPSSWTYSEAQSVDKAYSAERTMVWYPKDASPSNVNVSLLINNTSADFTSLGSFGSVEEFGTNLVNSMDRSYLLRGYLKAQERDKEVQTARLIEAGKKRGMYSVDYVLKQPEKEEKRLMSLIALRFDGRYNRLYTLTGQCNAVEYGQYRRDIETVMDSFVPPSQQ